MTFNSFSKAVAALVVSAAMYNASANSVGLEQLDYLPASNEITVVLTYDFTDFAMFGGGVDVLYDAGAIEFVSYTQAPLAADAQAQASPIGELITPGLYSGAGIGTFDFFNGMYSAGDIGTFVFNVIGSIDPNTTPCGAAICLERNPINPFVSLAGMDVTDELLANGSNPTYAPIPVPAAVWLMLSGLGALAGFGRKR